MKIELPGPRAVGGLLSTLLVVGLCVTPTGLAVADGAASRPAAKTNSQWLSRQLEPDGTLQNPLGGALPDHGLMIDTLYAMHASGDAALAAPIVSFMEQHATDYFTWDGLIPDQGFENIIVGGAAAKVLVAAEIAGRDPRNFGGIDMVAETQGAITRSGPDRGRISDYAKTPEMADYVSNNANMFGQSLGVIGLAGVGENDQLAIDKMLTQQCSEGYFRIFFGYIPTTETGDHVTSNGYRISTCDEGKPFDQSSPDGDATGFALSAMLAAQRAGAENLDVPIARTVAWLKANQTGNGGWGGGVGTEAPNTNSTGLIVQALADAGGADAAVAKGVAYLRTAQATAADAGNALADHVGAIAYNPESYQAAKTGGIVGTDTWVRASAQASLGLSLVGFYDLTQAHVPPNPPTPPPGGGDPPPPPPPPAANPPVSDKAGKPGKPHGKRGTVVTPVNSPVEQGTATPAGQLGTSLAGMLVDGDHVEVTEDGVTYVDYAATADLVLALRTLGEQPASADRASRFLLDPASIEAYAHGAPYEQDEAAYAEPLAKLRIVAGFLRATDSPPEDLESVLTELGKDLADLRGDDGRFADTGEFTDADDSVRRHAWAVLGLTAGPRATDTADVIDTLLDRQCADGTFPASLDTKECDTGDVAATAAAVEALNGRPQVVQPPSADTRDVRSASMRKHTPPNNVVPEGWQARRGEALVRAATALTTATATDGLVRDENGEVDLAASAASAAGRQAAGLDASATARAFGERWLPAPDDPATAAATAPGIAGRSWTSAADAPVAATLRLPLAEEVRADTAAGDEIDAAGPAPWLIAALVALGFLLAAALGFGVRRFHHRTNE